MRAFARFDNLRSIDEEVVLPGCCACWHQRTEQPHSIKKGHQFNDH